ncbi:MAG: hypothetical protein IPO25_14870 [Saprospiraceae bacterium]|nr:hypothetical protein [Saprospiraceae bacterium]
MSPSSVPDDKLMEVALQTNFNDAKEECPLAKVDVSNTSQSPEESTPAVQKIFPKLIQILKGILSRERSIPSTHEGSLCFYSRYAPAKQKSKN